MNSENSTLNKKLLAQLPNLADREQFRERTMQLIAQNDVRIRRERVFITGFWIFCVASAVWRIWFDTQAPQFPRGPFLACIFFLWGGIELLKHHLKAARVEALKEVRQLQLQILDLTALVNERGRKDS